MYERSAIVLERYFEKIFGLDQKHNVKQNYQNFCNLVEEIKKYQLILTEEEKIIKEFDEKANDIQEIQKTQEKLYKTNIKLEEDREQLFNDLEENPNIIEKKLEKIETAIEKNNIQLKDLKIEFVDSLTNFNDKKKERNEFTKTRREGENDYFECIKNASETFSSIEIEKIQEIKDFLSSEKNDTENELNELMKKNGKNEKVPFNEEVIKRAVKTRIDIAEKEAECYITVYEKMKRLMAEIENDSLKLGKYLKTIRDVGIKMAFLEAEKEYIVAFLDNERMTVINGQKAHSKFMEDACTLYDLDIAQIDNLYTLVQKEVEGKSTKKGYKELYNIEYLENLESKERNFEEEVDNYKISRATVINPNYWRIQGIKNIYVVFQEELKERFQKDLSEYNPVKVQEIETDKIFEKSSDTIKSKFNLKNILSGEDELDSEEFDEDDENNFEDEDEYNEDYDDEEIEENDDYDDEDDDYEDEDDNEYYDDDEDEYEDDDDFEDEEEYDDEEYDEEEYEDDEDLDDEGFEDNDEFEDEEDTNNEESNKLEDAEQEDEDTEESNEIEEVIKKIEEKNDSNKDEDEQNKNGKKKGKSKHSKDGSKGGLFSKFFSNKE